MRRLLRFSAAAGGGVFMVSLLGLGAPGALGLALAVVGAGWLVFAACQIGPELRGLVTFAAVASSTAAHLTRPVVAEAGDVGTDDEPAEPEPEPMRYARVHERAGVRLLRLGGELPHDRKLASFLVVGARVGSFKSRDMIGRRLPDGEAITFPNWRRYSDDLVTAGVASKDRKNGCRLRGDLPQAFARLEARKMANRPMMGDLVLDPAAGWQG